MALLQWTALSKTGKVRTETCNNRKTEDRGSLAPKKIKYKEKTDSSKQKHTNKNENHKSFRLISNTNVKLNITPK